MSASLHRRTFLALSGAAVAATTMPYAAPPISAAVDVLPTKPPIPTWIVGTPGEADAEVVRAITREAAILFRAEECEVVESGDKPFEDCDCGACTARWGYEATRISAWDGKPEDSITSEDWMKAGFETTCDRCGYECSYDAGDHAIDGKAVCDDCMTLADWDVVHPERAAELRAEMEDEASPSPSSMEAGR